MRCNEFEKHTIVQIYINSLRKAFTDVFHIQILILSTMIDLRYALTSCRVQTLFKFYQNDLFQFLKKNFIKLCYTVP